MARKDKTGLLRDLTTDLSFEYERPDSPFSTPTNESSNSSSVVSLLKTILITFVVCIVLVSIFRFTMSPTYIDGDSMSPTLKNGQVWFSINKVLKSPVDGDVIRAYSKSDMVTVVKRIVAKEGDVLTLSEKGISVNGELVDNSSETMELLEDSTSWLYSHKGESITLRRNEYFVLGDNRNNSHDSRSYGLLSGDDIQTVITGKAPNWLASLLR